MEKITIEKASLDNLDLLLKWRMESIKDVFELSCEPSEYLHETTKKFYQKALSDETHLAIFAKITNEIVGCGGICFYQEMPSPDNPSGQCAYFMNIYIKGSFRGKGVGRAVVDFLLKEALLRNIKKIYLETTDQARHLYEGAGFSNMDGYLSFKSTSDSDNL